MLVSVGQGFMRPEMTYGVSQIVRVLWVVAARRVAMDTWVPCSRLVAQGSLLALEPPPTLSGTIPKPIYWR